ncbi:hypothetical protein L2737_08075 [Shewanella electrodiphila]|uniref:Uncharacterized protein n=1 Tax=Shewanella electrodiphila TaxID=934143 RepID=A0ABT0KN63_9GAMM|nr:hypothetical protein [Shewanella electrodiphila]MCL1045285.1 hypothetical protein [Shewanella electrodiphila]
MADGLKIAGWVANQVDADMSEIKENLASLTELMSGPFWVMCQTSLLQQRKRLHSI